MKRETLRHPKLYDLMDRLDCSRPEAIGYLTLLWDHCADVAPLGDIGKWPDGAIARACDWRGKASDFIQSLVESGWLDRDDEHRLLIHDIADHAQQWWKLKLSNAGQSFIVRPKAGANGGERPDQKMVQAPDHDQKPPATPPARIPAEVPASKAVKPPPPRDQTSSNQTKPNPHLRPAGAGKPDDPPGFVAFWDAYPKRDGRRKGRAKSVSLWQKLVGDANVGEVMQGLKNYASSREALTNFAMDPDRWLRNRCWEDWQDSDEFAATATKEQVNHAERIMAAMMQVLNVPRERRFWDIATAAAVDKRLEGIVADALDRVEERNVPVERRPGAFMMHYQERLVVPNE